VEQTYPTVIHGPHIAISWPINAGVRLGREVLTAQRARELIGLEGIKLQPAAILRAGEVVVDVTAPPGEYPLQLFGGNRQPSVERILPARVYAPGPILGRDLRLDLRDCLVCDKSGRMLPSDGYFVC
jgi:hypothetical protein